MIRQVITAVVILSLSASLEANWTAEGLIKQLEGFRHGIYTMKTAR